MPWIFISFKNEFGGKRHCGEGGSEIWPYFSDADAKNAFNTHSEVSDILLGGFNFWESAVLYSLRKYANDKYLKEGVESLDKMVQSDD